MRQLHNDLNQKKTYRRLYRISVEKLGEIEHILQEKAIEVRTMTWEQLGYEVGLECTEKIVKNTIDSMHYCKYVVCNKRWVNKKKARN